MPFIESQKFPPWALWLMRGIFLFVFLLLVFLFRQAGIPKPLLYTVIFIVVISFLPCLALEFTRLKTKIDNTGIKMNFVPFSKKSYSWADIQSAVLIDYGFVGGWGVRIGTKFGTVYNTQGSEGLWLTLKSGKQLVIGTQRKDDLQKALDVYLHP